MDEEICTFYWFLNLGQLDLELDLGYLPKCSILFLRRLQGGNVLSLPFLSQPGFRVRSSTRFLPRVWGLTVFWIHAGRWDCSCMFCCKVLSFVTLPFYFGVFRLGFARALVGLRVSQNPETLQGVLVLLWRAVEVTFESFASVSGLN